MRWSSQQRAFTSVTPWVLGKLAKSGNLKKLPWRSKLLSYSSAIVLMHLALCLPPGHVGAITEHACVAFGVVVWHVEGSTRTWGLGTPKSFLLEDKQIIWLLLESTHDVLYGTLLQSPCNRLPSLSKGHTPIYRVLCSGRGWLRRIWVLLFSY